ncbi:hypothetical protein MKW98_020840 [Papaver atlanticum]|uniref:Uncharacterized protein n=1 Tax=Papaver atlanticum TaxID=357466 RepID=A0AAD4TFI3_9MAGN|nr:hypothetical protein MKW98_020840 [Papaver atlanticum]
MNQYHQESPPDYDQMSREIQTYLKDNPLDVKSLKLDVGRFEYAKLESSKYKKFIKSLKDDNLINYGVYFGRKKSLSKIFGLKPGLHEIESLVFEEDEFLTLPPRSSATNLCVKLKELGMPVELNGMLLYYILVIASGRIKLTKVFSVCEDKRVTKDSTKILRLLKQKMFKYALVPLCCWSASTGETEYFDLNLPRSG